MDLNDGVALVTGAGHRIGRAVALGLARSGAHVVVHYGRSSEAAEDTAAEIRSLGVEALPIQADLSDPDAIADLFGAVAERFGQLDVLVNSAATFRRQRLGDIEVGDWDAVQAVNVRAPFLCTQHAAPLLRTAAQAKGQTSLIVNVSDLSAVQAWRGYAHHGVSKAGVLHLTRITARELAPDIRVNVLVPGPILPPPGLDPEGDAWRRIGESVPLKRSGDPSDIAHAVGFLAAADYVTGAEIYVDGGQHLEGPHGR